MAVLTCKNCGGIVSDKARFCPHCGQAINATLYCPECGQPVKNDSMFCGNCGAPLNNPDNPAANYSPVINTSIEQAESQGHGKAILVSLLVIIILGTAMFLSCPDKRKHKDALVDKITSVAVKSAKAEDKALAETFVEFVCGLYLKTSFSVDDYKVCSVGRLKNGKTSKIVTFGVFGYIFTPTESQIQTELDKIKKEFQKNMDELGNSFNQGIENM